MDVVITYVNGADPKWIEQYRRVTGLPITGKRYRDWGTLKYLLRGIDAHLSPVKNTYLVVASESQIPSWVDKSQLKIVLHRDIIPEYYLPTFNSCVIEMFLHRISGLSDRFVYFNDDIFPVMRCSEEDLFPGGYPAIGVSRHCFAFNNFQHQTKQSYNLARKALGLAKSHTFIRPQHICFPMLRRECESLYDEVNPLIIKSLSPVRTKNNYNFYIFIDYLYLKGKLSNRSISKRHFSLAVTSPYRISSFINNPDKRFVCINDVNMSERQFQEKRQIIINAFENCFNSKSRYEK